MSKILVEVCAGNVEDCILAEKGGADQIELNSGVFMGGLTPSLATLILAKEKVSIPIFPMLRTRGAGFHYHELEVETMRKDAKLFAKHGANGLVFGFLNEDRTIDKTLTKEFSDFCKQHNMDSIFHRAFDQTTDPYKAIEALIECGITRILTSGHKNTAPEGMALLKDLQVKYGDKIELVVGAGVNEDNVVNIIETTGVTQVHSSFKKWHTDPTTEGEFVSYKFSDAGSYDGVDINRLKQFISNINQ